MIQRNSICSQICVKELVEKQVCKYNIVKRLQSTPKTLTGKAMHVN